MPEALCRASPAGNYAFAGKAQVCLAGDWFRTASNDFKQHSHPSRLDPTETKRMDACEIIDANGRFATERTGIRNAPSEALANIALWLRSCRADFGCINSRSPDECETLGSSGTSSFSCLRIDCSDSDASRESSHRQVPHLNQQVTAIRSSNACE